MDSSVKLNLYKFFAIQITSWAIYLFALVGWLQFSEAYFSASSPAWQHYLLGVFLVIGPFVIYSSIRQILRNMNVNYLYAFSPLVWVALTLVQVWFIELIT
jgi:hypothetical protein